MKLSAMIVLLALVAAPAFAYEIGIKVTVSQDTLAVGTNITIVEDGTPLYSARADGNGAASFRLDAGSYFVYLDRGGYSRHVNLLEVGGNENITYTMRQLISSASAYGQVSGPGDFNGSSVAAYANGNVAKRATPNKDGYYQMPFMPEGEYSLVFNAPGFVERNISVSLLQSQFSEVNARLDRMPVAPIAQPAIIAPSVVQKQSVIEILLVRGATPISGQIVGVKTPSGSVEVATGADGKARVNAVKPGEYVFTYGNLTAKTVVEGAPEAPAQPPAAAEPAPPPAAAQPQKPAEPGLVAGAALLAMGGAIAAIGIVLFAASRMIRKGKHKEAPDAHAQGTPTEVSKKHEHAHKK